MKRIYQHPWWYYATAFLKRVIDDPDLIYAAPLMVLMGLVMPWVFRLIAFVIGPALIGMGTTLFAIAIVRGVQRVFLRTVGRK